MFSLEVKNIETHFHIPYKTIQGSNNCKNKPGWEELRPI